MKTRKRRTPTWRFMGSYKWVISPLMWVITMVTLRITPVTTTHEPPCILHILKRVSGAPRSMVYEQSGSLSHSFHAAGLLFSLGFRGLGFRV